MNRADNGAGLRSNELGVWGAGCVPDGRANEPGCSGASHVLSDGVVCLRAFRDADVEPMFRNWASDPEVTRYLTWEPHRDVGETREIMARWAAEGLAVDTPTWAIALERPLESESSRASAALAPFVPGEPIGSIGIVALDAASRVPEIGYCIGRPWWHHGVTSRALALVIADCFEHRGAPRVEAIHDVDNPRSGLVMQRCGMTLVSETPELRDGSSFLRYAITREAWQRLHAR